MQIFTAMSSDSFSKGERKNPLNGGGGVYCAFTEWGEDILMNMSPPLRKMQVISLLAP